VKFNCPECLTSFSVPDEKIPKDREFKILCPKCRTPIGRSTGFLLNNEQKNEGAPAAFSTGDPDETEQGDGAVEVMEEGVRTCLLCISDNGRAKKIEEIVRQLDFYASFAPTVKLALSKMDQNSYDLVVLDEDFGGNSGSENLVLHHINLLPMHVRRQFFLCLLSTTMTTLDQMPAFHMGVNLILNVEDLDKAKVILTRATKEHRSFYRIFTEELKKKGQI